MRGPARPGGKQAPKTPGKKCLTVDVSHDALKWKERYEEAEQVLRAIVSNEVDALVVNVSGKPRVYGIQGINEEYRVMVENMDEGAAILNPDGMITYCNKSFSRILKIPIENVLGTFFINYIENGESSSRILKLKTKVFRGDMTLIGAGGAQVPVYSSAVRMPGGKRQIIFIVSDRTQLAQARRYIIEQEKARENINRLNEQLKLSLHEKEVLLKELHHRTKNNMNVISNLMNLQMRAIKDPSIRQHFAEAQNRIQSMALVHKMLYKTRELSRLDLKEYLSELARSIFGSYREQAKNIGLKLDMDPVTISLEVATAFGLLVNELLTNSVRHAFPGNMPGEIRLALKLKGNKIELSCSDNGVGLPSGFRIENQESLGLLLVKTISQKQLFGKLEVRRGKGTNITVSMDKSRFEELSGDHHG